MKILYFIVFSLHFAICMLGSYTNSVKYISCVSFWPMNIYAFLGFLWSEKISYIFSIAILSGIIFNVMMFIISKIGHRPCSVAENHIYKAWLKCIFILLFVFIAIGAWGANDTRDFAKLYALDVNYKWGLMKIFGVSAVSFIFGSAANFVGEAVLVTVSTLSRKK